MAHALGHRVHTLHVPDERLTSATLRLAELTRSGKLRWAPVAPSEDEQEGEPQASAFTTRLTSGAAVVSSAKPEGRYPYELRLTDASGMLIGRLETGQDAEQWLGDREAEPWEMALHDLYAIVRNAAVHADASLEAILSELDRR
jgi:hypothetical protein